MPTHEREAKAKFEPFTRTIDLGHYLLLLLLVACGAAPEEGLSAHPDSNSVPASHRGPVPQEDGNPFLSSGRAMAELKDVSRCVSLSLQIPTMTTGDLLQGELEVVNSCRSSVALLTAPVEIRERFTEESRFPAETGIGQIYATAYLFQQKVGLGKDAFRGDGGIEVTSPPEYAIIGAGDKRWIPLTSDLKLTRGSYGLALFTIRTPTASIGPGASHIDLRRT